MSFINKKSNRNINENVNIVLNHEGEPSFLLNPMKSLLVKSIGTFFGQDTFYEEKDSIKVYRELIDIIERIPEKDKEYVLKIAEIGRRSGMIEYPLNILAACYHMERYKGNNFLSNDNVSIMREYSDNIIRRTKDINHLLAIDKVLYGEKIPSQMKKNLVKKIEGYDEYKLSKGLDRNKVVSLADTIKYLRPNPSTPEMANFYKRVIENDVVVGNNKKQIQAEVEKIKIAQKENKEISLDGFIDAMYKANYSALIKNLSSYIDYNVFQNTKELKYICRKLVNKNSIVKSKIMPYEIYAAYMSISNYPSIKVQEIKTALIKALDISIENTQDIEGNTAFLIDLSGSMCQHMSKLSSISALDMACLLGAIAFKKGNGDLFAFSDKAVKVNVEKNDSIFSIMNTIKSSIRHGMTNLDIALNLINDFATNNNIKYDNLLLLSDGDCYSYDKSTNNFKIGEWNTNLNSMIDVMLEDNVIESVWLNNLTGNNFTIFNTDEANKNLIVGYNDKFIDMMNLYYNIRTNSDLRPLIDALLEKYRKEQ